EGLRKLTNLQEGKLDAASTEAVTGKQLHEVKQSAEKLGSSVKDVQGDISKFDKNLNAYLGGGADVLNGTAPVYTIQQYGYSDIGS
ncbi:hypothetical protein, partial [Bartonella schoenbuchensis]|uniref:hypothetical protein n=1 Tax=Bartonella schoenbuchensis TaxID=165694 RepID=UPI001ABB8E62